MSGHTHSRVHMCLDIILNQVLSVDIWMLPNKDLYRESDTAYNLGHFPISFSWVAP